MKGLKGLQSFWCTLFEMCRAQANGCLVWNEVIVRRKMAKWKSFSVWLICCASKCSHSRSPSQQPFLLRSFLNIAYTVVLRRCMKPCQKKERKKMVDCWGKLIIIWPFSSTAVLVTFFLLFRFWFSSSRAIGAPSKSQSFHQRYWFWKVWAGPAGWSLLVINSNLSRHLKINKSINKQINNIFVMTIKNK